MLIPCLLHLPLAAAGFDPAPADVLQQILDRLDVLSAQSRNHRSRARNAYAAGLNSGPVVALMKERLPGPNNPDAAGALPPQDMFPDTWQAISDVGVHGWHLFACCFLVCLPLFPSVSSIPLFCPCPCCS